MTRNRIVLAATLLAAGLCAAAGAAAQEAAIRKNLAERLPQLGKIDEVTKAPIPGLFEVRVGTSVYYTDPAGDYLVNGDVLDLRQKRNLTEERKNKLMAIAFDDLPVKDAFVVTRGTGKRKLAVFQDPNCGYCKKFERDLQKVDNVTIYMFLYPVLGPDSVDKSRNIWCAKDKARAWQDWMVRDVAAPAAPAPGCDASALERNRDFGRKHQITGTPTLVFADGNRVPGAIGVAQVEKLLTEAK
jgi:thiol:disulfide interchange protein DsbC